MGIEKEKEKEIEIEEYEFDVLLKGKLKKEELKNKKLNIPEYQRRYSWSVQNAITLLEDIFESGENIRLGTIILHNNATTLDVVDGQQRIITLLLLKHILDEKLFNDKNLSNLENLKFDKIGEKNILKNYLEMKKYIEVNTEYKESLKTKLENINFLVITVDKIEIAYQLFDSLNSRGLPLNGSEILKAYHLRACSNLHQEIQRKIVNRWNELESQSLKDGFWENNSRNSLTKCFSLLYKIRKWSRMEDIDFFDINSLAYKDDFIKEFKGINKEKNKFNFQNKAFTGTYNHQITEYIENGESFFSYIFFYCEEIENLEAVMMSMEKNKEKTKLKYTGYNRTGDGYVRELYRAVLLQIWDRFGTETMLDLYHALYKLCFLIRVGKKSIPFITINNNAKGEDIWKNKYSFSNVNNSFYPPTRYGLAVYLKDEHKNERKDYIKEIIKSFEVSK